MEGAIVGLILFATVIIGILAGIMGKSEEEKDQEKKEIEEAYNSEFMYHLGRAAYRVNKEKTEAELRRTELEVRKKQLKKLEDEGH